MLGSATDRATEMLNFAHVTQHEKIIRSIGLGLGTFLSPLPLSFLTIPFVFFYTSRLILTPSHDLLRIGRKGRCDD